MIPIYRNGRMEDVYWTYSYSPVLDEAGQPVRVFVTCTDTTAKVLVLKKTLDSNKNFYNMVAMCVFREPEYVV